MACRVLVVDDEATVRDLFSHVLTEAGCEVRTASDAMDALATLASEPADVVVSDLLMPGLRGEILVEQLQARFPETRIVVVSGWVGPQARAVLSERGVDAVLQKPLLTMEPLIEAVRSQAATTRAMAS